MKLIGADGLHDRLAAMARAPRGYSRDWADEYVRVARPQIPMKTGKTRRSVQVARVTNTGAQVEGSSVAVMIDTGTKRHGIEPTRRDVLRFQVQGRTVFSRKVYHPGMRARPYRERAADEALRRHPLDDLVIDAWNRAD